MAIRTLLDGIDYRSVFWFPRVLGAVTASMQPPRLVIGLVLTAILLLVGRSADLVRPAVAPPDGLLGKAPAEQEVVEYNEYLRSVMERYVPEPDRPDGWRTRLLDPHDVAQRISTSYRARREVRAAESEGAAWQAIEMEDAVFVAALRRIEAGRMKGTFEASLASVRQAVNNVVRGVFTLQPGEVFNAFADLFIRIPVAMLRLDPWFAIAYGLVFLLATAIFGGALARMSACDFARREKLSVRVAIDFAWSAWRPLVLAPLVPLILVLGLVLLILVLGLFMTVPGLDVLGAILYGLALLLGFFAAFLLLGYAASFPLLIPAVVCERCDAADAQQRAVAYLLARPLHLAGYLALGILGFAAGFVVVAGVVAVTVNITGAFFSALTTNSAVASLGGFSIFSLESPPSLLHSSTARAAGPILQVWQSFMVGLVAAWVFSYFYAVTTRVYLLMRGAVDGEDIVEIWREGLVPGTQVPATQVPSRPHATEAPASSGATPDERGPGRAERMLQSTMRAVAAARAVPRPFRGRAPERTRRTADSANDAGAVAPASDGSVDEQTLGPELIPEQDRRTGLSQQPPPPRP